MPKATKPISDAAAREIGRAIFEYANNTMTEGDAKDIILRSVERPGGNPSVTEVIFVPDPQKDGDGNLDGSIAVVVPDASILNEMRAEFRPDPGGSMGYSLSEEHLNTAARQLMARAGGDKERLFIDVTARSSASLLGDPLYHFVIGDYSVKRCW